jgi:gamma-glutamylcysteine synthetase
MSDTKTWGSTVLGWFVVQEDNQLPADSPPEIPSALEETFTKDVPAAPGGQVDFDAVFDAAGITADQRSHCSKAVELVATLPAQTEAAIKKQIVEISLKAFGVPIEKIIEASVHEIQALEGYIQADARDSRKVVDESQVRIAQHEQEIEQIRTVISQRSQEQQSVMQACNARKLEIQHVLEFFGQEAVARVVRDSPKLVSPSDGKAR